MEIEGVCFNRQETEELTLRGVGHTGDSNSGGVWCNVRRLETIRHV